MGGIPVLNDQQMAALRRVVGTPQKFDLTVAQKVNSRRLPSYADDGGDATPIHPFDVEIVNNGTEESPSYAVKVYDSTAPESEYAGIVYLGTRTFFVPTVELAIEIDGWFVVELIIVYDSSTGYSFTYDIRSTSSTITDNNQTARYAIANGTTSTLISRITSDIHVNDRWV